MLAMLAQQELIGHSGNIIANDDMARLAPREFFVRGRHGARFRQVVSEKLFQTLHGAVAVLGDCRMIVDVSKQESLQRRVICRSFFAEARQPFRSAAHVFDRGDARLLKAEPSVENKVARQKIQHSPESFIKSKLRSEERRVGKYGRTMCSTDTS